MPSWASVAVPRVAPLEGLSGPVGALGWLGAPLAQRQAEALRGARLPPVGPDDPRAQRFVFRDDLAFSQGFAQLARMQAPAGRDVRVVLGGAIGALSAKVSPHESGPLVGVLAPGGPASLERLAAAEPLVLSPAETTLSIPLPGGGAGGAAAAEVPMSAHLAVPVGHWLGWLWANLLALGPWLFGEFLGTFFPLIALRYGWAALRARSVRPARVGAALGRRGRGCVVHPSAVVEGSWLGDGVHIGANAVVRGCVLADGAAVEDLGLAEGCVLGPGARVLRTGMVKFSVLGPRAMAGGDMQLAALDAGASVKLTAALFDQAFGQPVEVGFAGMRHPAPFGFAGVCVGAGTAVGGGVRVAPGRVLPAGLTILADPDTVVRRVPAGLSGAVVVRGGALEPL